MGFIESGKVEVFPSALRGGDYSKGKFTTEHNLTNFLKAVTDKESFVISDPRVGSEGSHYSPNYKFVINGFYFEVEGSAITTEKFAFIRLDSAGRLVAWDGSTILDSDNHFKALHLSDNESQPEVEGLTNYKVKLTGDDRFIKFESDVFSRGGVNLNALLDAKEDKFSSSGHKLDLSANLVEDILPTENGGTGKSNLADVIVGKASAYSEGAVGNDSQAIYINSEGKPVAITRVSDASKLSSAEQTGGLTVGSVTNPVYFENGVPVATLSDTNKNINAYVKGLQEGKGNLDTEDKKNMTYTSVYFDANGNAQEGITIHISDSSPESTSGKAGDLWFRYSTSEE